MEGDGFSWQGFEHALRTERIDESTFEARCQPGRGNRIFGGNVAAHAVMATASRSASDLVPLSLHVHFLRAGDALFPVIYDVTALRSGRSFEHWRVDARQGEHLIATHVVVLHRPESGPVHAAVDVEPESPEDLPSITSQPRAGTNPSIRAGFDMRRGRRWTADEPDRLPFQRVWFRCREPLPADPALRAAVLVWASDLELVWAADLPYRERTTSRYAASLDHVVHLHSPLDPSAWWLYEQECPSLEQGRALVNGRVFAAGRLAASVSQQALLRLELAD